MKKNAPDELLPTRWTLIGKLKNWDDQESWREFFDTYWKLIYGVAIKSGLTHPEAQDVVQETVMSVCKNIQGFKADPAFGSFKSWLLTMTRWRITDQVRKRAQGGNVAEHRPHFESTRGTASTSVENRLPDPANNALERIWNEEWEKHLTDRALEKVKAQSSAEHFQIFYLVSGRKLVFFETGRHEVVGGGRWVDDFFENVTLLRTNRRNSPVTATLLLSDLA